MPAMSKAWWFNRQQDIRYFGTCGLNIVCQRQCAVNPWTCWSAWTDSWVPEPVYHNTWTIHDLAYLHYPGQVSPAVRFFLSLFHRKVSEQSTEGLAYPKRPVEISVRILPSLNIRSACVTMVSANRSNHCRRKKQKKFESNTAQEKNTFCLSARCTPAKMSMDSYAPSRCSKGIRTARCSYSLSVVAPGRHKRLTRHIMNRNTNQRSIFWIISRLPSYHAWPVQHHAL